MKAWIVLRASLIILNKWNVYLDGNFLAVISFIGGGRRQGRDEMG